MARGIGPDGAQPPARGEGGEQFVSRVGGVGHYLPCPPQVVEGWQIAADHLLCRADDSLQPALILGCGCGVLDGDGGGEDGLHDGGVEVHHHRLWQVEFLQLPQLYFFDEGAEHLHLRSWAMMVPRKLGAGGAAFFLNLSPRPSPLS